MERTAEVVGGHRIIERPLRHSGHDLDQHVRWECVECGVTVQGHEQAVDLELADAECPAEADR